MTAEKVEKNQKTALSRLKAGAAFLKTKKGKIWGICILAVMVLAATGLSVYGIWLYRQPKVHDLTLELGSEMPGVSAFLTEYASAGRAELETPVDLTRVGEQVLSIRYGHRRETAVLTIEDTSAPVVTFQDVTAGVDVVIVPEDFLANVEDASAWTATFLKAPEVPDDYEVVSVEVAVTDACGNMTVGECLVNYQWIRPTYTLELGDRLGKSSLLYHYMKDSDLLTAAQIAQLNAAPVGEYTLEMTTGEVTHCCVVTVQDTTAPRIRLQDVTVFLGETATLEDFVVSCWDISGDVTIQLTEELPLDTVGTHIVTVTAEDIWGNIATRTAELRVILDTEPPVFSEMDDLYAAKYSTPNYTWGVTAVDARDGEVEFSVDDSRVDVTRAGTYYAVYTARDHEGNTATYRRKVVINHDAEDTAALVASIAAGLSSNPETIRDYVRDNVWYSSNWGGDDPVWYGFKNQTGNCYVHALCFQALLQQKGYETQLIWVEDQSHYWLLVKIGGVWKHMDATPGTLHSRYSIMNDAQRYETLNGRNWDRTAWPAVE